jgi:hypothetical protein
MLLAMLDGFFPDGSGHHHHGCRTLRPAFRAATVLLALLALLGSPAGQIPVSAADRPLGPAADGAFRLAAVQSDTGVTLTVDLDGPYDAGELQAEVREMQSERLSDAMKREIESEPSGLPRGGLQDWVDFDATVALTATGFSLSIPNDQPHTTATEWQATVASGVGTALGFAFRALCIGAAGIFWPPVGVLAKTVCTSLAAFVGGMIRAIILMAIDHKLRDGSAWGAAVVTALLLAASGWAWESGINVWAEKRLPVILAAIGNTLKKWVAVVGRAVGDFFGSVIDAVRGYFRNPPPALPRPPRMMALGDSITYGQGSSSGSGYRGNMKDTWPRPGSPTTRSGPSGPGR